MSGWMMFSSHTNQVATDWWSISAISSGCAKQVKLEKNQCEGTQKTINNRSNEWLTPSLCLFVCFASFIHSFIGKQNQNWVQRQTKIKWEQFLLLFLLLPSATFHFFCILGASTIIDTIVQMWSRGALERTLPPTSTIYASPRPARLHCEQIWLRFSQQRRRFGTWGLVGGTWDLGKKEGGSCHLAWLARIVLRFVHDSSTWRTMAGGKERVGDEDATKLAAWYLFQSVRFERWVGRLLPSNDNQSHSAFVRSIDNSHFGRGPGRACWKVSSRALTSGWPRTLFLLDRHQEEVWWGEERQKKRQNVRSLDSQAPLTSCALDEHLMHSSLVALLPLMLMYIV